MLTRSQAESQLKAALDAVRAGRSSDGLELLLPLLGSDSPLPPPWFLAAQASRMAGDRDAMALSLEKLLDREPEHIGGLLMLASDADERGNPAKADPLFRRAIAAANAAAIAGTFPPALAGDIQRAMAWVTAHQRGLADRVEQAARTAVGGQVSPLVAETLAILKGEAPVQLQQPQKLFVPGLPQRAFYEREEFDWVVDLERQTPTIREECRALLDQRGQFEPYIPARYAAEAANAPNAHLVGKPDWGAFHLFEDGSPQPAQADACPATMAALARIDQPRIPGLSPMALFSLLGPGAHIKPHHGLYNHRLICHLPLIVPGRCTLRVGNHQRDWADAEILVFDDSIEHEAWNRSDELRVVLLFDIWRPEIGKDDRLALSALIAATSPTAED